MLPKENLTEAVNLRRKIFRGNFICSTLEDGKTLLDKAVEKQNADMIWLLLESIIEEDCVLERQLMAQGVNATGWIGPALMCAAAAGHGNMVKYLVEQGADVNAKDSHRRTALMCAAGGGHENIVKYLVEQGADVNAKDSRRRTALMCAAGGGHENIVKYLVEQGADVNAKDFPALMEAAEFGHENIVKYLVEQGADVNAKNKWRFTALMEAAGGGHENIVKYLVEQGADVNVKNEWRYTALMCAAGGGHENIVKYLVEQGADVNAKDFPALVEAAGGGHENIVRYLVEQSDSITVRFKPGKDKKEVNNIIEILLNENERFILVMGIEAIDVQNDKLEYSIVIDSCEEDLHILTDEILGEYKDRYDMSKFDIICWTHPHDDHSYGMLKLLQEYSNKHTKIVIPSELGRIAKCMTKDCKKIYDYTKLKTSRRQTYGGEVKCVSKDNRVIKKFFEGNKKIKFIIKALAPISHRVKTEGLNCKYDKNLTCYHQFNEFSVVLFIRLGQFRFLFTADATNGTIKKFRFSDNNEYRQFKNILFLKVPHHGSLRSNVLLNKFNTATCENMICVTTASQIGDVMLPNKRILDEYAKLGNVYCTSGLYSRNKTYGIVKSIFKFGYDGEKLNIEDIECKTEGDACKYETVF